MVTLVTWTTSRNTQPQRPPIVVRIAGSPFFPWSSEMMRTSQVVARPQNPLLPSWPRSHPVRPRRIVRSEHTDLLANVRPQYLFDFRREINDDRADRCHEDALIVVELVERAGCFFPWGEEIRHRDFHYIHPDLDFWAFMCSIRAASTSGFRTP